MLKFELTEQIVVIIGRALGRCPYDEVAATINELQRQINEQRKPKNEPVELKQAV